MTAIEAGNERSRPSTGAIDWPQLRALLRMYLRLSMRTAILMRRRRGGSPSFAGIAALYGFMGAVLSSSVFLHPDVLTFSFGLHSVTLFVVGMAAIIEANEVLFDRRQGKIFAPLPVDARTLLLARAITLVAFASIPAFSLNAIPMFAGVLAKDAHPWFPLVHLISVFFNIVFACALVVCTYGVVLRLFGRERFDDLAVWTQLGMGILYVAYFQIVPQLMRNRAASDVVTRWLLPTPPGWYAALDAFAAGGETGLERLALAGVAIAAPVVLGWIALGRLSAAYAPGIEEAAYIPPTKRAATEARPWGASNMLLRAWMRDPLEWAAFRLAVLYLRRDRETKLAVYNVVALFAMFSILSVVQARQGPIFTPLMLVGFSVIGAMSGIETLRSSSNHAAAQLFAAMPITSAAPLFYGVRKACLLFLQLPLTILSLAVIGWARPDRAECFQLALPILLVGPTVTLFQGSKETYVPLARPRRLGDQFASRSFSTFFLILGLSALIGIGYAARHFGLFWVFLAVEALFIGATHVWLRRAIARRQRWVATEALEA
jgi:hypothetical protein